MNRWKIIRSDQDKYAFICMFKTDNARNSKQESQFMMSMCQEVSSFNVSMLTSSLERWRLSLEWVRTLKTIHLTSCSLVKSSLTTLEWGKSGWGVFVLVKFVLVCLFMVGNNLLRNLMCLCHHQTMPPRLSLCPVCMSSPLNMVLFYFCPTRNSWSSRQLLFNLAFYYEFYNNNEDVPNKIRIWKTRRFSEIVFRHICI